MKKAHAYGRRLFTTKTVNMIQSFNPFSVVAMTFMKLRRFKLLSYHARSNIFLFVLDRNYFGEEKRK